MIRPARRLNIFCCSVLRSSLSTVYHSCVQSLRFGTCAAKKEGKSEVKNQTPKHVRASFQICYYDFFLC